jgi:small subunit ribosomal protein S29
MPLELREALGLPMDGPTGPYAKRSPFLQEYTRGLRALPVPERLSVQEASSLFELWMKSGALHSGIVPLSGHEGYSC